MYKIGEFSKLCRISVKTLRYYAEEGLLVPDEVDRFTGYRYYSAAQLERCNRILTLKALGFSLEDIRCHLEADSRETILGLIRRRRRELSETLSTIEAQLRLLESIEQGMTEGERTMFDIVIRKAAPMRLAYVRRVFGKRQEALDELTVMKRVLPARILGTRTVIVNNEIAHAEEDMDLCVGVEITEPLRRPLYDECELDLGEAATLVCGRDRLEEGYGALIKYIGDVPAQIVGAFAEVYHEDGTVELSVPVVRLEKKAAPLADHPLPTPFENDEDAIGKWVFVDKVPSEAQFLYEKPKYPQNSPIWLKEIYFLPGGQGYWILSGWTKGQLGTNIGSPRVVCCHAYTIKEVDGKRLMFIQMKDDSRLISRGGRPEIYVYEQVSREAFDRSDIRIRDFTDMPFEPDPQFVGEWQVVDLVREPSDFDPAKPGSSRDDLFFTSLVAKADGEAIVSLRGRPAFSCRFTRGFLLNRSEDIAEAYYTKEMGGSTYLFMEWKSGDYIFGGRKPVYYVFKKC